MYNEYTFDTFDANDPPKVYHGHNFLGTLVRISYYMAPSLMPEYTLKLSNGNLLRFNSPVTVCTIGSKVTEISIAKDVKVTLWQDPMVSDESNSPVSSLSKIFPVLKAKNVTCQDKDCKNSHGWRMMTLITHLNDDHAWSREAIAEWLESLDLDINAQPLDTNRTNTID